MDFLTEKLSSLLLAGLVRLLACGHPSPRLFAASPPPIVAERRASAGSRWRVRRRNRWGADSRSKPPSGGNSSNLSVLAEVAGSRRLNDFVRPVCPQPHLSAEMKKGRPGGRPFHCRAVVRLNYRKDANFRRPGAPRRRGSSSRMPATAAIDNETLDHLLSITDLALAALGRPAIAMFSTVCEGSDCRTLPGGGPPWARVQPVSESPLPPI